MSHNSQWDSQEFIPLDIPYNRVTSELQETPRFVRGQNTYVTIGGKIVRRPGTTALGSHYNTLTGRVDRAWFLETLDNPPVVYIVVSVYDGADWELWYQRQNGSADWTKVTDYRQCNESQAPHEACVSRGQLFIKGLPSGGSGEKLGSIIFNGDGGTVNIYPWGALGPVTPVALASSGIGLLTQSGGISETTTSFTVNITDGAVPAAPFVIQIDYEQMLVSTCSGTSGSVTMSSVTRAYNETTAATHDVNASVIYRGWTASAHNFVVNIGWQYSYAYKSITGNYSNRAPQQTNPDSLPSDTGPFFNQLPQITVQGLADTTNFPSIGIFRTTDGGGTWFFVQDITNTGAGAITYTDDTLASSGGNQDPLPDTSIDSATIAPSLTDHSPPPTVTAPKVVGTDTPTQTTPIAWFQGRLWYGINNILFFSALEEVQVGIPEECWPSGLLGDFFRFQYPITNVVSTSNNLYVFTTQATYTISGTNLATFAAQEILDNMGFPYGQERAIDVFENSVVFLSHDYRIVLLTDQAQSSPLILSDPLFMDIVNQITAGAYVDIKYFGSMDKRLIFVTCHNQSNPTQSVQFVYDIKKSVGKGPNSMALDAIYGSGQTFWNLPWTYPSTAQISCRTSESSALRQMIFFNYVSGTGTAAVTMDQTYTVATDVTATATVTYNIDMVFCLTRVPAGNHVNQRRQPKITPILYSITFERTAFNGDADPSAFLFTDDLWTTPIPLSNPIDPPRRADSIGYKTMEYPINQAVQRVGWEITKANSTDLFELQNVIITYESDGGA